MIIKYFLNKMSVYKKRLSEFNKKYKLYRNLHDDKLRNEYNITNLELFLNYQDQKWLI